jgi:hypothetical protein
MRVLRVLLALVIPALFASVSQAQAPNSQGAINGQGHNAAHCAARAALHPGEPINKCDPAPPPAPTCSSTPGPILGGASISGTVTNSSTFAPLANWCIEANEITGVFSSKTATDLSGNYQFTGLPAGTYTVCIELQSGWSLDFPSASTACPGSLLTYTFTLALGDVGGWVNFSLH